MRKLPPVLAISAAFHAVALVCFGAHLHAPALPTAPPPDPVVVELLPPPPPPPPPPAAEPAAEPAPIDVVFLGAPTPATTSPAPTSPAAKRSTPARREAIVASTTPAPAPETAPAPATTAPRNPYMDMRRPGAPQIALPRIAQQPDLPPEAPSAGVPVTVPGPAPPDRTNKDQGVFTSRVDAGGNVKLKDAKNINMVLTTPKMIGKMIGDWYMIPDKPVGQLAPDHPPVEVVMGNGEVKYLPDATTVGSGERDDHGGVATIPVLSGGFDVSDAFMRRHGQDPYAAKKLAYLDATRDERVQIGVKHRSEQLADAPKIMQGNLERLWATVGDAAARREALFELWDESAEDGSAELVAAGARVRGLVLSWIRTKLPAGSPDAYGADELAALNRRRSSRAVFAPY